MRLAQSSFEHSEDAVFPTPILRKDMDMRNSSGTQPFQPPPNLKPPPRPFYHANFLDGSLSPDIDELGVGALQFGFSDWTPGEHPPFPTFDDRGLLLRVEQYADWQATDFATAGVYALPLNGYFDRQPFTIQGTFVGPFGPFSGVTWAVGIVARTGLQIDSIEETQCVATLQFNPPNKNPPPPTLDGTARLNVPFGAESHTPVVLPAIAYDEIVGRNPIHGVAVDPVPFVFGLSIDPLSGLGNPFLTVGEQTFSPVQPFVLSAFQENSGKSINAIGTVVANSSAVNEIVSVHVRDFEIYAGPPLI